MSELPDGWTRRTIGSLCELINGRAFKPSDWGETGLPIVRIQNLNNPNAKFNCFSGEVRPRFLIDTGVLLFAWSGTPGTSFGAHIWNGGRAVLNQHIFNVLFDEEQLDKHFLRLAINQKLDELIDKAHGGVGLRHVTKGKFEATEIDLPPLDDQRRIVAKLDSLFERTKSARYELSRIPRLVERYKEAVLAAAFRGDLTADWRANNRLRTEPEVRLEQSEPYTHVFKAPLDWPQNTIEGICEIEGGSQPPKTTFKYHPQAGYIRFIQIRDYKSDDHVTYIPTELARRFCAEDDVMIGRYGPPIFQILRGLAGAYNVALMKAVPRKCCSKEFLFYRLQDPDLRRYVEMGSDRTAGQDGVNKAHLLKYPVYMPSIDEQYVIVERVLNAFDRIKKLSAEATRAQNLIERLDHATLAKAFRGEFFVPKEEETSSATNDIYNNGRNIDVAR